MRRLLAVLTLLVALPACGRSTQPEAQISPTAAARVSPTPLANQLAVPDSMPIIIYADPASTQLDGITWDGKTSGKLRDQHGARLGNPQNNLFAGSGGVTDRAGNTVMTGMFGPKSFAGTWADDGRHFCQMVPFDNPGDGGLPTTLQLVTVGQGTRDVARIGTLYNQTFMRVAACSVLADRAVVVQSGGQGIGTAQVWVIEVSTGRTVWTHAYDVAAKTVNIVASRDGMYVAEDPLGSGPLESTVYGPDGSVVAHVSSWIAAFSWDGSLAVVAGIYGVSPIELVSWRDGTVLWSYPPGAGIVSVAAEPGGSRMAIWLGPMGGDPQTQTPDLYVVDATGSVTFRIAKTTVAPPA